MRHLYEDSDGFQLWPEYNYARDEKGQVILDAQGEPYSPQRDFIQSRAKFLCGGGGFGGGKTFILVRRALALMINSPYHGDLSGNVGCIGRKTLKSFEETTLPEIWRALPGGQGSPWIKKYYKKDGLIELVNCSTLRFAHLDEIEYLASYNFGFVAVDQMEQIDWEVFKVLAYERIRNKVLNRFKIDENGEKIQIFPKFEVNAYGEPTCISTAEEELNAWLKYQCVFGVCNPRAGWIKEKFVKNEMYKKSPSEVVRRKYNRKFKLVTLSTFDNIANLPPDYISNQKDDKSARDYKRSVLGSWDAFEGQVYEDFTDDHILNNDKMPMPSWDIYAGLDHGGSGTPDAARSMNVTGVIFFALEDRLNNYPKIHVFDELELESSTIEETVDEIYDKQKAFYYEMRRLYTNMFFPSEYTDFQMVFPVAWRCGHDMQKHMDDAQETIVDCYVRHAALKGFNLPLIVGGSGIQERIHKINWMFRKGLIDVNPKCVHFIQGFKDYEYGRNEKPRMGQNNHIVEAFEQGVTAINLWHQDITFDTNKRSPLDMAIEKSRHQLDNDYDPIFGKRYSYAE